MKKRNGDKKKEKMKENEEKMKIKIKTGEERCIERV